MKASSVAVASFLSRDYLELPPDSRTNGIMWRDFTININHYDGASYAKADETGVSGASNLINSSLHAKFMSSVFE